MNMIISRLMGIWYLAISAGMVMAATGIFSDILAGDIFGAFAFAVVGTILVSRGDYSHFVVGNGLGATIGGVYVLSAIASVVDAWIVGEAAEITLSSTNALAIIPGMVSAIILWWNWPSFFAAPFGED